MEQLEIGARLRKLRKEKNMSIAVLAERSGVSTGLISQIERELVVPSAVSLYRIATALDIGISYFFNAPEPLDFGLQRKGSHKVITTNSGSRHYTLLAPDSKDRAFDLVQIVLKAGEEYDLNCVAHEGEECGYVLSGVLTVLLDSAEYTLNPGDSFYFYSNVPHKYLNRGDEDCVSVWAMTPKFF